jgi:esterase/lipase superfamily enzyme
MPKHTIASKHLGQNVNWTRWGEIGVPVLFFPTAAADCEEVERFLMVQALAPLLAEGRIKLYSVDSVAGQALLSGKSAAEVAGVQAAYDRFLADELVPAIRHDCRSPDIELVATGPSIGAFHALSLICCHPELVREAICLSGTYDITKWMNHETPMQHYHVSPLHFVRGLPEGGQLHRLRSRFIQLFHGTGRWEEPEQSWRAANVLGARQIPNNVLELPGKDHDWPTWREILPGLLRKSLERQGR